MQFLMGKKWSAPWCTVARAALSSPLLWHGSKQGDPVGPRCGNSAPGMCAWQAAFPRGAYRNVHLATASRAVIVPRSLCASPWRAPGGPSRRTLPASMHPAGPLPPLHRMGVPRFQTGLEKLTRKFETGCAQASSRKAKDARPDRAVSFKAAPHGQVLKLCHF